MNKAKTGWGTRHSGHSDSVVHHGFETCLHFDPVQTGPVGVVLSIVVVVVVTILPVLRVMVVVVVVVVPTGPVADSTELGPVPTALLVVNVERVLASTLFRAGPHGNQDLADS